MDHEERIARNRLKYLDAEARLETKQHAARMHYIETERAKAQATLDALTAPKPELTK